MRSLCHLLAVVVIATLWGCGSGTPKAPATPEGVVSQVAKGLSEDKPQVVWQSLPASYQKDVNDVIGIFAKSCDPDIYNQGWGVTKKLVQVLQKKKDLIITHPQLAAMGVNQQQLAQNWDAIVNLLSVAANSEISDLAKLKSLDVDKFLSGTGSQLMKSFRDVSNLVPSNDKTTLKAKLDGVKATNLKTEGDTVTIKIEVPGEKAEEVAFKQVEGKWIPKKMADGWKADIAKAKADMEKELGANVTKNKEMVLSQLKMLDGALDLMLAAKTAEEFNNSVSAIGGAIMGLAMSMPNPGMGAQPVSAPAPQPAQDMDGAEESEEEEGK
ncbi:MAG TPA: hypothetical protein VEJ63_16235 [Planctomycetota bacterium]|nr:hypothetical protein [Planctomycetota bacterium]